MKVSTKGRYAVLAMYELALNFENDPITTKAISDRQHIPKQYLDQLMKKLRQDDLVISNRGAKGGYKLKKTPSQITIGEIIRAVEEPTRPVECFGIEKCGKYDACVARVLWGKIADSISEVIDNETLQDMLEY